MNYDFLDSSFGITQQISEKFFFIVLEKSQEDSLLPLAQYFGHILNIPVVY